MNQFGEKIIQYISRVDCNVKILHFLDILKSKQHSFLSYFGIKRGLFYTEVLTERK